MLMISARAVGGPAFLETIEELDRDLTKVIGDFDRAVDVEALRLAKKSGKPQSAGDGSFSVVSRRARPLTQTV